MTGSEQHKQSIRETKTRTSRELCVLLQAVRDSMCANLIVELSAHPDIAAIGTRTGEVATAADRSQSARLGVLIRIAKTEKKGSDTGSPTDSDDKVSVSPPKVRSYTTSLFIVLTIQSPDPFP